MITREVTSIELALEQEQRTMERQTLLKKLWRLRQSRTEESEEVATAADQVNVPRLSAAQPSCCYKSACGRRRDRRSTGLR